MADRMDFSPARREERILAMARAVHARRKALRLTQIALSQLAGCGPDFVYDVEAGKTTLRLDKLLELLNVLGLELVLGEGKDGLRIVDSLTPPDRPAPRKRAVSTRDRATKSRPRPVAKKRAK